MGRSIGEVKLEMTTDKTPYVRQVLRIHLGKITKSFEVRFWDNFALKASKVLVQFFLAYAFGARHMIAV